MLFFCLVFTITNPKQKGQIRPNNRLTQRQELRFGHKGLQQLRLIGDSPESTRNIKLKAPLSDAVVGTLDGDDRRVEIVDLPGHYGLNLDRPESVLCRDYLAGRVDGIAAPDALLVIADATNLHRNLMIVSQALQQGLPTVVALNMIDLAPQSSQHLI